MYSAIKLEKTQSEKFRIEANEKNLIKLNNFIYIF